MFFNRDTKRRACSGVSHGAAVASQAFDEMDVYPFSSEEDERLLAKIVALLRTGPFVSAEAFDDACITDDELVIDNASAVETRAVDQATTPGAAAGHRPVRARLHRIGAAQGGDAAAICMNLVTLAHAFADLTDRELQAVPEEIRGQARGELIGVWKILDLIERMEATRCQLQAEG